MAMEYIGPIDFDFFFLGILQKNRAFYPSAASMTTKKTASAKKYLFILKLENIL